MAKLSRIKKRDGTIEDFNPEKIQKAILQALDATRTSKKNAGQSTKLAKQVVDQSLKHFSAKVIPTVEDVQDIVEEVLMKAKLSQVARAYILYREKHKDIREFKTYIGVRDDLKLAPNSIRVLARRYLLKNEEGDIIETPARLFRRVAKSIANVDKLYGKSSKKTEETFYNMMTNLEFLPNTPTLMNAGTKLGQLSACFVLPIEDSLESIFDTLKHTAMIHQSGGGTGFSFSRLRPKGDIVQSTKGIASGPVSYMGIYDKMTDVIKQGGRRRGANMGVLHCTHPDLTEFITAKTKEGQLTNFNISVAATDKFMNAVAKKEDWKFINPRTNKAVKTVPAEELFELIVSNTWATADPGLVFIDEINRTNTTKQLGEIESTNPCGEQPLHPYESCNLGSINLSNFVRNKKPDWKGLKECVINAVHFLDNVVDANKYPLPEIETITKANRRIGLGVMGFAEMLVKLGTPYDSNQAVSFAEKLMKFVNDEARKASNKLGEQRGSFPNFEKSTLKKHKATRNATVTTIAPTGTISIVANTTSGIEPLFAVSFIREVLEHTKLLEVNQLFEKAAKEKGIHSKSLMMKIAKTGTVQNTKEVPKNLQRLFITALDIKPEWHVKIQAAFQKHCDNGVSKTVNLPEDATINDIRKIYLLAHKLKCKGITVYRYGSKKEQVLYFGKKPPEEEHLTVQPEYAGGHVCEECVH